MLLATASAAGGLQPVLLVDYSQCWWWATASAAGGLQPVLLVDYSQCCLLSLGVETKEHAE